MEPSIFNYIDSILCSKKYLEGIKHDETQYNIFMCNRWISMYSDTAAEIINDSSNKYWPELMQHQDHYEFLFNLMPVYSRKKIDYIKKIKDESSETSDDSAPRIAKSLEISQREVKIYSQLI